MLSPGQSRVKRLVLTAGTSDVPTATMIVESAEHPVESFVMCSVTVPVPVWFQRIPALSLSPPEMIVPPHTDHW
jgi:hypothetical protein